MEEGISELQGRISSDETRFHGGNRAMAFRDEQTSAVFVQDKLTAFATSVWVNQHGCNSYVCLYGHNDVEFSWTK